MQCENDTNDINNLKKKQAELRLKTQIFPRIKGLTDEQWLQHVANAAGCTTEKAFSLAFPESIEKRPVGTLLTWKSNSSRDFCSAVVLQNGGVIQVKSMMNGVCKYHDLDFENEFIWRQTLDLQNGEITIELPQF